MRAVWIATVDNIDWPSKAGLSPEEQKKELVHLLNLAKQYNLNTIVFQVRPAADAFYSSSIEPWSQWLNGKQGLAPEPFYDPLEFAISECRKRGLDIHAWVNPYRAETEAGQTNYDDLFADILLWQKNGWIDYITPQIYWYLGFKRADYSILTDWWSHNSYGCNLYIGQAPYRIGRKAGAKEWRSSRQIIRQIKLNHTFPNVGGSMFFSAKVLQKNPLHLKEKMIKGMYRYQSLPPSNNRITPVMPHTPSAARLNISDGKIYLSWEKEGNNKKFIIYKLRKGKPADLNDPENIFNVTSETGISFPASRKTDIKRYFYVITARSETNTESDPEYFKIIEQ